jgi:hypothetical protein
VEQHLARWRKANIVLTAKQNIKQSKHGTGGRTMSKEKQIEERLELSSIIGCAVNDWGDFCEECHKDGYSPTDTLEEYVAVSVLTKGYRKQSEGEWIFKEYGEDTYTNLTRIYECSLCGRTIECLNEADEPYCHCGAKMKGV